VADTKHGGGTLWQRTSLGAWVHWNWPSPTQVTHLVASPTSSDVWILTDRGLWHQRAQQFRPVAEFGPVDTVFPEPGGSVLTTLGGALVRIRADSGPQVVGLDLTQPLEEPQPFAVEMAFSSLVS